MMDARRIQELIPHRPPFLLVDEVLAVDPEEISIVAQKKVAPDEPYFEGHFPGRPIMPGVLVVEALAQTGLICMFELKLVEPGTEFFFAGIEQVKFRRPVVPGDLIQLRAKLLKNRKTLWKFEMRALVEGRTVAEGLCAAFTLPQS